MKLIILMLTCPLLVIAILSSCGGGSDSTPTPSATAAPSSTTQSSATPSIEDEIGGAYLQYWDAYSAALLALDSAPVAQSASGQQLQRIQDEIDGLRAQGVAER